MIDITGYRQLSEADQIDLYKALKSHAVLRHLGKQGVLILPVKNVNLPATDNNVRGITVGTHLSKVPLAAFFATRGTEAYEGALGGPYLVDGIPGISIIEVVRTVVMTADVIRIRKQKFQIAIMDKRQFFDRIPQESHPEAGAHLGLGTREEWHTQITGFTTITPLGDWETPPKVNARGAPQGTVQGCHVGNTCAMPMIYMLNKNYSSHAADILRTVLCQYADDGCSVTVENPKTGIVDPHPAQGNPCGRSHIRDGNP